MQRFTIGQGIKIKQLSVFSLKGTIFTNYLPLYQGSGNIIEEEVERI